MCRELLRRHPQARSLVGPDPRGALAIPALLALHWGMAFLVSRVDGLAGLAAAFVAAFFYGQLVLHSAGGLLHETAHRLVFRARAAKLAFDLSLELVLASFARQLTYQHEHVSSHHRYMGIYDHDYEHEDVCALLARRDYTTRHPGRQRAVTLAILLLHLLPFGFLATELAVPWFYRRATGRAARDTLRRIPATRPASWERRLFIAVSLAVNAGLLAAFGFGGWLYHNWTLSIFLGKCGVTNLGQSLAEHEGDDLEQPTRSYYGWMNALLFNTGYHNEHHTLPSVPWSRLPALRALAPEMFVAEAPYGYARHWWEHVRHDFRTSRRNDAIRSDLSNRCPASPPSGTLTDIVGGESASSAR
jgi:sphingolipid 4-desaturase/C4-monooxygenase